jgi:hypothetical protein
MITLLATRIKGNIVQGYSCSHFTGTDFDIQLAYDDRILDEYDEVGLRSELHNSSLGCVPYRWIRRFSSRPAHNHYDKVLILLTDIILL